MSTVNSKLFFVIFNWWTDQAHTAVAGRRELLPSWRKEEEEEVIIIKKKDNNNKEEEEEIFLFSFFLINSKNKIKV